MIFVVSATVAYSYQMTSTPSWYVPYGDTTLESFKVFASYFVLLAFFIPISLFVNLGSLNSFLSVVMLY